MNTVQQQNLERLIIPVFLALERTGGDKAATEQAKARLAEEYGVTPDDIQGVIDSIAPASRDSVPAEPTPKAESPSGEDHDTPETEDDWPQTDPTQEQKQEQEQEQKQEESTLSGKVRKIVEEGPDEIAIEQALKKLHAELPQEEKVSLGALKKQANAVRQEKKDKARRKEDPPALKALNQAGTNLEGTGHRLGAGCSFQFAVAGQQPQSKVATLLARHNSGLAYDHVAQKWLQYTGTQWKDITDTAAFRAVKQWIDAGLTEHDGYTASFLTGVITFLKAELATDGFDDDPSLVPFKNGVLNLSTMNLIEHSPELKISWCLPFDYNPHATCEPIKAWLKESAGGDDLQIELLRAYIKAILTGRSDLQRYLELIGPGGTGKGEYIRLCMNVIGKRNVHVTELKHLEQNRFETSRLYRKRLCVATDAEKYNGEVSTLKAMTGGDYLRFEEKHKQGGNPSNSRAWCWSVRTRKSRAATIPVVCNAVV